MLSATSVKADKIARLVYTNSGIAIMALASNGTHLLWKWCGADASTNGKATTTVAPLFVIPASGAIMINDLSGAKPEYAIPCCALSKNDSYVMSASGGKVSLFNLMTFKTMTSFMSPPPEVTCLAFHPDDNNVVAVGFNDSTIHIYNVRTDKVTMKLVGHSKAVTFPPFSSSTFPSVVAANPHEPSKFAVGLTDGVVIVLELLETGNKWGVPLPTNKDYLYASTSEALDH